MLYLVIIKNRNKMNLTPGMQRVVTALKKDFRNCQVNISTVANVARAWRVQLTEDQMNYITNTFK